MSPWTWVKNSKNCSSCAINPMEFNNNSICEESCFKNKKFHEKLKNKGKKHQ